MIRFLLLFGAHGRPIFFSTVFKNLILRIFFFFCYTLHDVKNLFSFAPVIIGFRKALSGPGGMTEQDLEDPICQLVLDAVEKFEALYYRESGDWPVTLSREEYKEPVRMCLMYEDKREHFLDFLKYDKAADLHVLYQGKVYHVYESPGEAYGMLHDPEILKQMCDERGADYEEMKKLSEAMGLDFEMREEYAAYKDFVLMAFELRRFCDMSYAAKEIWDRAYADPKPPITIRDYIPEYYFYIPDVFFVCFIVFMIFFCLFNTKLSNSIGGTDLIISLSILVYLLSFFLLVFLILVSILFILIICSRLMI